MPAPHFLAQNGGVGIFNGAGVKIPDIVGKSYGYAGSRVQTIEQKFRMRFDDGGAIGQGSGDFRIKTGTSGGYTTWTVNNGQINIWTDVHLGRAGRQSWNNAGDISLPHGWKNSTCSSMAQLVATGTVTIGLLLGFQISTRLRRCLKWQ